MEYPPRSWHIDSKGVCSGHGDYDRIYYLRNSEELKDPPKAVVDKAAYDELVGEYTKLEEKYDSVKCILDEMHI